MYLTVKKCSEAIEEREDCKVAKVLLIPSEESLYRTWTMRGLSQLKNWMPRLSFYLSYYEYMYMLGVGQWRFMQRYVMEHFVFPGNTDFTADDLGAKCHSCISL